MIQVPLWFEWPLGFGSLAGESRPPLPVGHPMAGKHRFAEAPPKLNRDGEPLRRIRRKGVALLRAAASSARLNQRTRYVAPP
jgi:hypothetical protein